MPSDSTNSDLVARAAGLRSLTTDFLISRALHVAVKLGLPDLLAGGPQSVEVLADRCDANADALFRLMRALAVHNIFVEQVERQFGLTDLGDLLRSGAPGSMRDYVLLLGEPVVWRASENLEYSIKTGGPAFDETVGQSWFSYLAANPSTGQIFDDAMRSRGAYETPGIIGAYDFSKFGLIADLGGGEGGLLSAVLESAPLAKGILFDLPRAVEAGRSSLAKSNVFGRIEFVAGDLFNAVPASADLYMLKNVLHDFSDELAAKILDTCRRAMTQKSRLLVLEMIIEPESAFPKRLDLMMLVWLGGKERTKNEWEGLLARAGFKLTRALRTATPICVLEAEPTD